jgi:hypothetical protein
MHPLHDYFAKQLADKLTRRGVVVWYDPRREFTPFFDELRVRKVKVGANVPVFVLEFLLGKYCASSDEIAIQMGLQVVNDTLANNYIRADESIKAQAMVKDRASTRSSTRSRCASSTRTTGPRSSTLATRASTSPSTACATTSAW